MSQVSDRVLQWLYNALLNDYRDPQRTYADTASVLAAYQSLSPRTDVYTYNTGQPALLLRLSGTLPVNFRGTVYRFPITIWVPHAYPHDQEGVMVFVNPGEGMAIRPGQHVGVDGRVYHPYLRDWAARERSTRSNLVEFLRILQDVFAREPPVIAKQQQQQQQQQYGQPQIPTQRPAPPPKERQGSIQPVQPVEMPAGPAPPTPPKPGDQAHNINPVQSQQSRRAEGGPPLPPLPHEQNRAYQSPRLQQGNGFATPPRATPMANGQSYSNTGGPPVPPLPFENRRQDYQTSIEHSPVSPLTPNSQAEASNSRYAGAPPLPVSPRQDSLRQASQQMPSQQYQGMPYQQMQPQQSYQQQPQQFQQSQLPPQSYQQRQQPQYTQPPKAAAPLPDLLTDPFDISLPTAATGPAPPIPPNPEREHLLALLSTTLVNQIQQKVSQNGSALTPLHAQSQALQEAHNRMTSELAQLQQLDGTLASNEQILHRSLHDCDAVIESSKSTPAPPIDEVLVAPTVVAQQLWNVQADEAAIREALWCLQRAVGAGRVGGGEFVRLTRGLAREAFLKMALSRKIAKGMGLDVGGGGGARGGAEGGDGYYGGR